MSILTELTMTIIHQGVTTMSEREIEKFYSDLERGMPGYKRPSDYKERALRMFDKQRKPFNVNNERGFEHE